MFAAHLSVALVHHLSICLCVCVRARHCVRHVRRQVAGKEYTRWDDFDVDGRRDGGRQEMTLEDLFSHVKVAAPPSSPPEDKPLSLSSHPARPNAYFSITVFC